VRIALKKAIQEIVNISTPIYSNMYYALSANEYAKSKGYIGTPGFYTINGHHHCTQGQPGCVSTDPKKSLKLGYKLGPGECRPDLDKYGKAKSSDCAGQGGGSHGGHGHGGGGVANTGLLIVGAVGLVAVIAIIATI
jgi:hypothetical protein